MDTETKQNQQNSASDEWKSTQNHNPSSESSASESDTQTKCPPTMAELLEQSPVPSCVCNWIACMRKAGISLTYSLEKKHIADMNHPQASEPSSSDNSTDARAGSQSGAQHKPRAGASPNSAVPQEANTPVGSIDAMTVSGTCRIRYFDLALGALGILSACCLIKCCCHMKHKWF